jgi:hypothetical protein
MPIKAVWANMGYSETDFLGFLINRCGFEQQLEKIHMVRDQLQLKDWVLILFNQT